LRGRGGGRAGGRLGALHRVAEGGEKAELRAVEVGHGREVLQPRLVELLDRRQRLQGVVLRPRPEHVERRVAQLAVGLARLGHGPAGHVELVGLRGRHLGRPAHLGPRAGLGGDEPEGRLVQLGPPLARQVNSAIPS